MEHDIGYFHNEEFALMEFSRGFELLCLLLREFTIISESPMCQEAGDFDIGCEDVGCSVSSCSSMVGAAGSQPAVWRPLAVRVARAACGARCGIS